MAAEVLLNNVTKDSVSNEFSIRIVGSQAPPAQMTIQIAIKGGVKVQIQGRLHRNAPWADIGEPVTKSCLFYIAPIGSLRAVSTETGPESAVSVWAAWGV